MGLCELCLAQFGQSGFPTCVRFQSQSVVSTMVAMPSTLYSEEVIADSIKQLPPGLRDIMTRKLKVPGQWIADAVAHGFDDYSHKGLYNMIL